MAKISGVIGFLAFGCVRSLKNWRIVWNFIVFCSVSTVLLSTTITIKPYKLSNTYKDKVAKVVFGIGRENFSSELDDDLLKHLTNFVCRRHNLNG